MYSKVGAFWSTYEMVHCNLTKDLPRFSHSVSQFKRISFVNVVILI